MCRIEPEQQSKSSAIKPVEHYTSENHVSPVDAVAFHEPNAPFIETDNLSKEPVLLGLSCGVSLRL